MADNVILPGTDQPVSTEEVTTLNGDTVSAQHVQRIAPVLITGDGEAADVSATSPLPVSGPLTDTELRAAPVEVDASGVAVPVTDNAGSLTVDNPQLSVVGSGTEATAMRVTIATDSTGLVSVDDNGGNLSIDDGGNSITVDNATISVVGSGTEATAQRVTIATDSTGVLSVDDNGASLTVDNATISVVGGGTEATAQRVTIASDSTGVLSVDDNGGNLSIDDGGNTITVDNGGTFAVQDSEKVADNAGFTDGTTKVLPTGYIFDEVAGTALTENDAAAARIDSKRAQICTIEDETTRGRRATVTAGNALKVDASGVAVPITDNAGSLTVDQGTASNLNMTEASAAAIKTAVELIDDIVYTDDTSTHATGTSKGALLMAAATPTDGSVNANDIGALAMTTDRKLHVSVQDALPAGSAAIGKLAANSGVDIGDVDVTSLTGGTVAHDAADSGNPLKVGGRASNSLDTATMVASGDRIDFVGDLDGSQIARTQCPIADIIHVHASVTGTSSTALTAFSALASTRNMITSIVIHNSGATDTHVLLQDGSGGTTFGVFPAPSKGGCVVTFAVPIPQPTTNLGLFFKANDSSTTVFVTVTGFQTKAG